MKGNIKITVESKDESGTFPITETFIIERDNTYEVIDEWIGVFKKILYCYGYHPSTIKEVFPEE